VLDVGAGSGYFCALLLAANKEARVVGIELVPELVALAKANLAKLEWFPDAKERLVVEQSSGKTGKSGGVFHFTD
jgi:protein-L-isoaspartate O-methyltransferase